MIQIRIRMLLTNILLRAVAKKALAPSICSGTVGADCFEEII
jgi:hypothetical protein